MGQSKDLYLRDRKEANRALAITKGEVFDRLVTFSLAEFASRNPSQEEMKGANAFANILRTLPEESAGEVPPISTGLTHDLSVPVKTLGDTNKS